MRRLFLLLALSGCGVSFPSESKVEDLRILEIRTSPPEIPIFDEVRIDIEADQLGSLTPNFDPVRLTALVAHPDLDATFDIEWIRCRGRTGGFRRVPCSGQFRDTLDTGTPAEVRPIELAFADLLEQMAEDPISALASDPRDLFSGLRFFFNARASVESASIDVDTLQLEGTKRLLVFDPTIVALALREARRRGPEAIPMIEGVDLPTLCTNVSEQQFSGILDYLRTREPNRAPIHASVEYTLPAQTATQTWSPGDAPIEVGPNESITLRGRVAAEDKETYRAIDDRCRLIEFTETMAWSWFTNVGELSDRITSEGQQPLRRDTDTSWRAPPAADLEQDRTRVRIWSVLRDGRGGSDSRFIDLVISKDG